MAVLKQLYSIVIVVLADALVQAAMCLQEEVEAADAALHQAHASSTAAAAATSGTAAATEQTAAAAAGLQAGTAAAVCLHQLLRVSIWFHHIKSTQKRKDIVAWARELNIGA
jgi:hypothetical protein